MNENKICFIICYNDELFLDECCFYIRALHLPDGMEMDILSIKDAPSINEGYQAGMESSDAKYKVYLHQDTFIINEHFIDDIVNIFKANDIGMIGMVGSVELPKDAVMWRNEKRCGRLRRNVVTGEADYEFEIPIDGEYMEVQAVDGFLMATSVDVDWRADIFKGWHFYDVSHSFEMRNKGYKVVVPKQDEPWCLHDVDVQLKAGAGDEYMRWNKVFLNEYRDMLC